MEPRISIITLGVTDLARSVEFYRDGLGLPLQDNEDTESIAFFELKGAWLALYPREEVNAVLDEAVAAGATLVKAAQDVFWGGYSGYFADPEGYLWEVAWNPYFPIDSENGGTK